MLSMFVVITVPSVQPYTVGVAILPHYSKSYRKICIWQAC